MKPQQEQKYTTVLQIAILMAAIIFTYINVFGAGFISWDDADYVANNTDIQSFANISKWFSSFYIGNYHPLTMVSYAIDYLIGNTAPAQYHITNIILHSANALMLYAFVNKIQGNRWVAFFVALLFAIHPVQTESVSWVAERKNVLSGFFSIMTMWLYTRYLGEEKKTTLLLVVLAAVAAMLSKATAVALPVSLLAIDIWLHRPLNQKKVWVEKLPLLLIALTVGIIAIKAQASGEFLNHHPEHGFLQTIGYAGYAYVQYIIQLIVPVKPSVLYPYPELGVIQWIYTLLAIGIAALAVQAYRKQWFVLCGGIVFYSVNIALVLQFIQFGDVLRADRYMYLACIGIWIPLVQYAFDWLGLKLKETTPLIVLSVLSVVFAVMTYQRNDIWQSEKQFWQAITETFPNSAVAQSSLGGVYMKEGDYISAMEYIDKAVTLDANNYKAWYNKGVLHLRKGELSEAALALDKCIALKEYPKALFSRALLHQQAGHPLQAMQDVEKVLAAEPRNARAHFIMGNCLEQNGNYETAIASYNKAIEYGDGDPLFYIRRGVTQINLHDYNAAIHDFSLVIEKNANNGEAWYWRGMAKQLAGQMPCHDLNKARNLGYKEAEQALVKFCNSY
ncbi:MAG: tetratricopeptide repeat protein [Flavipsychrobacter sp.]|nr:tetratricopeptide repeat protein [Flavipsychrobacter sp.]